MTVSRDYEVEICLGNNVDFASVITAEEERDLLRQVSAWVKANGPRSVGLTLSPRALEVRVRVELRNQTVVAHVEH